VKLDPSEPHGIRQSRLRIGGGKAYEGRLVLAGDPSAKVIVSFGLGSGAGDSQTTTIPPLAREYKTFRSSSLPALTLKRGNWKSSARVRVHFKWVPYH